jgi:hypothetical protein
MLCGVLNQWAIGVRLAWMDGVRVGGWQARNHVGPRRGGVVGGGGSGAGRSESVVEAHFQGAPFYPFPARAR